MQFEPTEQQKAIVALAKEGGSFKIEAYAGAAKTTTLCLVADELVHESLYLAYNKRMAEEATEKFPGWVEVRTTHSLAYRVFGVVIAHKLTRPAGAYKNVAGTASEIGRYFKLQNIELAQQQKITATALGKVVKDTVGRFENSAAEAVQESHIVYGGLEKYIANGFIRRQRVVDIVLPVAKLLWQLRSNATSPVLANHETYLKMFQLSKPDLSQYKTIYVDEAQDSNDCILDIVLRQQCQIIIVGDSLQAIYQWRGSVNALEKVELPKRVLSTSFRFGQSVADVASIIIAPTRDVDVRGEGKTTKIVDCPSKVPYPLTKIFRTNSQLLLEAIEQLEAGKRIRIEVDFKDLIRSIESGVALFEGRTKDVKHDNFVACSDWQDAKFEAKTNGEVKRVVELVENGGYIRVLNVLANYKHPENPEATYITGHKSKGLEWDNVVIAEDMPSPYDENGRYCWPEEERNLAYVMHTRAKKVLCVGSCVEMISMSGDAEGVGVQFDKLFVNSVNKQMLEFGVNPLDDITMLSMWADGCESTEGMYNHLRNADFSELALPK